MPWVSRDWKAKWLHLVWELVAFLSLVLSATEATRYAGLAVLVSKPSRCLLYVPKCCRRIKKKKRRRRGNPVAKGADRASVQKADQRCIADTCPLQKGINQIASSNGIRVVWLGVGKSRSRPPSPLLLNFPFLALLSVWDLNSLKPGLCSS